MAAYSIVHKVLIHGRLPCLDEVIGQQLRCKISCKQSFNLIHSRIKTQSSSRSKMLVMNKMRTIRLDKLQLLAES